MQILGQNDPQGPKGLWVLTKFSSAREPVPALYDRAVDIPALYDRARNQFRPNMTERGTFRPYITEHGTFFRHNMTEAKFPHGRLDVLIHLRR